MSRLCELTTTRLEKKPELVLSLPTRVLPVVRLSSVLFHSQPVHVCRQVCIILQSITPGGCHLQSLLLSGEKKANRYETTHCLRHTHAYHAVLKGLLKRCTQHCQQRVSTSGNNDPPRLIVKINSGILILEVQTEFMVGLVRDKALR